MVGCGRVGSELASSLVGRGHEVSILDKNARAFRRLPEGWNGKTVIGFGFDKFHLEEAGAHEADALAAVTSGDNSNILTARIARETYRIPAVVARIYDPRRAAIYQRLGIPTVATVTWTTDQVMRRLLPDASPTEWTDATGTLGLLERDLPAHWAGRNLSELNIDDRASVISVVRSGEAKLFGGDMIGKEGDIVHLAVATGFVEKLDEFLASGIKPAAIH